MIIYGTRAVETAKGFAPEKCPNCGAVSSIDMHVFQKYAHVFWIPFFPFSRTGVSQCDKCKQILKLEEMPADLRASYDQLKKQTRTPVWMFAGVALVVMGIIAGVIFDKNQDAKNAKLIMSPQKGDIYEVRTKSSQYTIYKVALVERDSVFLYINNYETNKSSGLNQILMKGDAAFSEEVYGFSKTELKAMVETDEIMDIIR